MTIALSANTPRVSYTVSQGATQTSFAVPFVFFTGSTDLNVFVDNVARTFDASTSNTSLFTVSGGNGSTGTVTTSVTGATGGSTVVITRAIPLSRTTDFPSSGAFEISKLNTELDTVTAIQSDFNDSASRAIRLQDSDSAVSMELPLLASRKGTVLGFNATTGAAEAGPTITAVQSLADVTTSINLLGTSAVVTDMGLLATSANITAMGHLGTSSNVTAMGLLGTSDVVADMALLGTSDVVADMALLANTDVIADMNTLATSDIISDLNTLATSDIVTDMNLLATSDNVTAMGVLGTSANVTNMATLGASGVISNIATVAGVASNVTTVAGISSNVTTVAGISSNVTTVAGVASNVTTVANNISGVNSFAERYRVQSGVPSSDNDVGDLVFDTAANTLKVFGSSGFQNAGSSVNGTSERFTYNITGTPTTLTGASGTGFAEANSNTLAYDAGFIDVYLNGVKMVNGTDVTVTSGTSVVFASALSNGDVVDIVTFGTFSVANIVSTGALNSGSITSGFGNIDIGSSTITTTGLGTFGTLAVNGASTITTADNTAQLTLKSTDADANAGPLLDMKRDSSSPADGDFLGQINFIAENDASQEVTYAQITGRTVDVTDGTEDGRIAIKTMRNGSSRSALDFNTGETVFNDDGDDVDFRVESDNLTDAFFINGANGNVGIGTDSPDTTLDIEATGDCTLTITAGSTSDDSKIDFVHGSTIDGGITYDHNGSFASEQMQFRTGNNTTNMRLDGSANLIIGNNTIDQSALSSGTGITLLGATGQILQAVSATSINYVNITNYSSGTRNFFVFTDDGSTKGTISYNGSNTAYNTSSDYRLKENFVTDFDATSRLKQLKPTRFNFIGSDLTQDGFLAHEVSNIVPEAITGEKDAMQVETRYTADDKETQGNNPTKKVGDAKTYSKTKIDPQGIDQSKLVPLLTKALQEQQATIEALTARITALESA